MYALVFLLLVFLEHPLDLLTLYYCFLVLEHIFTPFFLLNTGKRSNTKAADRLDATLERVKIQLVRYVLCVLTLNKVSHLSFVESLFFRTSKCT